MQLKPLAVIVVLSLVVVSLSIAGCTSSITNTTNTANTNPENSVNVTVKAVEAPQQFNFSTLRPDDKYVQYDVTFTNINARDCQVSGYYSFTLLDANKNVYTVDQGIQSNALGHTFPYGYTTTQPGDQVSGRLIFEVPQDATLVALRYHDDSGFNVTVPFTL